MSFQIIKNLTVTQVKYQLVELPNGVPTLVPQPDAVFRGVVSKERVKKLLTQRHGSDATIFIVDIDSGAHRFVMDFEDFVRAAHVEDIEKNAAEDTTGEEAVNEADESETTNETEGADKEDAD